MCDEHEHHLIHVPNAEAKELKKTCGTSLPKHDGCEKCDIFRKHIQACGLYKEDAQKDIGEEEIIMSVDLQKVMMLPRLPGLKKAIFCQRLVMFNESFVPAGMKHGKGIGVLWHEGIAGRSAAEITSMFVDVLRSPRFRDSRKAMLWVDNCSGQNKNWWLFGALVKEVNKVNGTLEVVTVKFFEPGHTLMSANSFHSPIEKGIKKKKKLQDFLDLVDVVNERRSTCVKV